MDLENFIKSLQILNDEIKQNREKYTVKCDIEFIPRTEEILKPKENCYSTQINSTCIIYQAIIEKEN